MPTKPPRAPDGFDVKFEMTVGHVSFGAGDRHPHVVAMIFIAEHGEPGVYSFPREDGGTQRVTVEHIEEARH